MHPPTIRLLAALGGHWTATLKNTDFIIEQYRAGKPVRVFAPSGDSALPWQMSVNGKTYLRTHGWVLSKILPTLLDGSSITTRAILAQASTQIPDPGEGA